MQVSRCFPAASRFDLEQPSVARACGQRGMITFRVAEDDFGWTVPVGDGMRRRPLKRQGDPSGPLLGRRHT